jgi:hypothetical protein
MMVSFLLIAKLLVVSVMNMKTTRATSRLVKCKKLDVPKDCCYLRFGKSKAIEQSFDSEALVTIRHEQLILDWDKKTNLIVGIELLGSKQARKPCQTVGRTSIIH